MLTSDISRGSGLNIVAIGGGTGLSAMLRGLKMCSENITAIVTVADDGGGSGVLRHDLGILPPGDIRNCILALANTEPTMERLLNYRFPEGVNAGQSFGNLFLAALNGISASFDDAIARMSEVLAVTGRVVPVSHENVRLEATFENGASVLGESSIFQFKKDQRCPIRSVRLLPEMPQANAEALDAIARADLLVFGPGSLYTSIIPNFLVDGIARAVRASTALRVYACNIMTQEGETEGYSGYDHAAAIAAHGGVMDVCLANCMPITEEQKRLYAFEGASATYCDSTLFARAGIDLRFAPLLDSRSPKVRHHPLRLARALLSLYIDKHPRGGLPGEVDAALLHRMDTLLSEGLG